MPFLHDITSQNIKFFNPIILSQMLTYFHKILLKHPFSNFICLTRSVCLYVSGKSATNVSNFRVTYVELENGYADMMAGRTDLQSRLLQVL